jgi:hypothetical protein
MASDSPILDYACPECFAYPWLCNDIQDQSKSSGNCPHCLSQNQPLIPILDLYDAFANLLSAYRPVEDPLLDVGTAILDLIQDDWEVFSERLIDNGRAGLLLEGIMRSGWDDDSGEPVLSASDPYVAHHSHWTHDTLEEIWEQFAEEVLSDPTRELKFHDAEFHEFLMREEIMGSRIRIYEEGTTLYRARRGFIRGVDGLKPYQGSDIGAPPSEEAGPGRANAEGEVVLYCTIKEPTAIAEVRPVTGEYVSVAEINTRRELNIVDLMAEPELPNPFVDDAINYRLELAGLLAGFANELSKPLRSRDDPTGYIPSQKLTEIIKATNVDGLIYPSAIQPNGANIVLFDPSACDIGPSRLVEVVDTRVNYRDVRLDKGTRST